MSLDSRWLALVRDTTSKNPDKWVTLSELDNYLNEDETERIIRVEEKVFTAAEPDGSSLEERIATLDDSETGKVAVLESVIGTPSFEATISEEVSDILSQIPSSVDRLLTPPGFNATPTYAYARLVSGETGPTEGDTVTVNDVTYTFVDALTTVPSEVPGEVLIATLPESSLANLAAAVNGAEGKSITYANGTEQPDNIAATVDPTTPFIEFTTDIPGSAGNSIDVDFSGDDFDWDGAVSSKLIGGMDVTTAVNGRMVLGTNGMLYISDGASGALVSNWKKIPLWAWSSYVTGDGLSTRIDKAINASPHAIVIIDNADADADYVLDDISQTVVIVDNNAKNIELPASTGSGIEIRITNKSSNSYGVVVSDSSSDVIDAEGNISLAQYASCILVDVSPGMWAQF